MLNLTIHNNQKECKACNIVAMNTVRLLNLVIYNNQRTVKLVVLPL